MKWKFEIGFKSENKIDDNSCDRLGMNITNALPNLSYKRSTIREQYHFLEIVLCSPNCPKDRPTRETSDYSWLINVVIIFTALTGVKPARRVSVPVQFPLLDVYNLLKKLQNGKIDFPTIGQAFLRWESTLAQGVEGFATPTRPSTSPLSLVNYLGICASPLDESVRERLHPLYVMFHDENLRFYPPRVSKETVNLESPFHQADLDPMEVVQKDHEVHDGLWVREYLPKGWRLHGDISHLPALVWFSGGLILKCRVATANIFYRWLDVGRSRK